eukprot:scaffold9428_cov89-Skeletonema_marinoi.AAC.2
MRTKFFSRWTDDDLLSVLVHEDGDFAVALKAILHHEAKGRPPEDLIRLMSGGEWPFDSSSSCRRRRSHAETENIISLHNDSNLFGQTAGLEGEDSEPVALNRNWSEGAVVPSYGSVPTSSSTLLVEGEGAEHHALSRPFDYERQQINRNFPENRFDMSSEELQTMVIPASSASTTTAVANTDQGELSESGQRHLDSEPDLSELELEPKHQKMLDMQSGIEAPLKETKNASETDPDTSYAVKVSKETFDEEYRNQELRKALEERMIKISLAASLSDPVKKSEDELIGEALKISLADPVHKSEEQLIEEARENSLEDIERMETIIKSEEDLVEAAKQKSLHTMSKEEELIEAVKRQSLKDARNDPLWRALEESLSESLEMDNQRRLTSSTHLLSCGYADNSECSSSVEHPPPSRLDSPLIGLDADLLDRKMPALVLPPGCGNNVISSSSLSHPNVASTDVLSSASAAADQTHENDNRSGSNENVAQHLKEGKDREMRCLSVEGASLSLINGVYKEEVNESNVFTLLVLGLNGGIATVASIFQTPAQGGREWVISITSSYFSSSETESGMDVILYTASVDIDNSIDDLPSPSTNWVGRNAIVLGGSPPKVTVLYSLIR